MQNMISRADRTHPLSAGDDKLYALSKALAKYYITCGQVPFAGSDILNRNMSMDRSKPLANFISRANRTPLLTVKHYISGQKKSADLHA